MIASTSQSKVVSPSSSSDCWCKTALTKTFMMYLIMRRVTWWSFGKITGCLDSNGIVVLKVNVFLFQWQPNATMSIFQSDWLGDTFHKPPIVLWMSLGMTGFGPDSPQTAPGLQIWLFCHPGPVSHRLLPSTSPVTCTEALMGHISCRMDDPAPPDSPLKQLH